MSKKKVKMSKNYAKWEIFFSTLNFFSKNEKSAKTFSQYLKWGAEKKYFINDFFFIFILYIFPEKNLNYAIF